MDELKNTRQSPIPAFFDRPVRLNPFGQNRSGERAYRRCERIVAAMFLITNHIDPSEPLRQELRQLAPKLLSHILDFRREMRSASSPDIEQFRATLLHMMSLVKLLGIGGFISAQNAEIAVEALDDLGAFITSSQRSESSEGIVLSREDFTDVRSQRKSVSDIKDTMTIKDNLRSKDMSNMSENVSDMSEGREASSISSRGNRIIEVLRDRGEVSIRDVVDDLPEYSEKMVQRELAQLVTLRLVKRTGSKRWSRYQLVS